jgi:hypothetical protein
MMNDSDNHKFHIPVLGTGFSLDAPLKVSRYGISSVVSLADDTLMEKLRAYYSKKYNLYYSSIGDKEIDSRAKRITAYLNLMNNLVKEQFQKLKHSAFESGSELSKYFEMLPDLSGLKIKYKEMLGIKDKNMMVKLQNWLRENINPGSIDVNIMTKLDKANFDSKGISLPVEYNDAHAALRGFANSELESSVVFSAGINTRLFSYLETFKDFFPKSDGGFKKKIIIKVSDFRSALIQGKFLANKGLWVSEYRIESGLNCGGHAFATNGYLLGPILEEFAIKKNELLQSLRELLKKSLLRKNIFFDDSKLNIDITVQGGVGKSNEQNFLIRKYGVKSVGWGSPFLLVPEVMNVDDDTLEKLSNASEDEIYLSNASPLGVPFNNLKTSGIESEKAERIKEGKPGAPCVKKFLVSNKDYSDKPACTASITYINKKINDIKSSSSDLEENQKEFDKTTEKVCLCVGLGASLLKVNNIDNPKISKAVSVCPGPNLAYFSKTATLKEMLDHIHGRINLITNSDRPNMFIKELSLYKNYFFKKVEENLNPLSAQAEEYLNTFHTNLMEGIKYYKKIIPEILEETEKVRQKIKEDLIELENSLSTYANQYA